MEYRGSELIEFKVYFYHGRFCTYSNNEYRKNILLGVKNMKVAQLLAVLHYLIPTNYWTG